MLIKNRKRGWKLSEETKKRLSEVRTGEGNGGWKGDNVKYGGLHKWVRRHLGKPDTCEFCGKTGLSGRKIHWASKSRNYLRDLTDWLRLCAYCHGWYDGKRTFGCKEEGCKGEHAALGLCSMHYQRSRKLMMLEC